MRLSPAPTPASTPACFNATHEEADNKNEAYIYGIHTYVVRGEATYLVVTKMASPKIQEAEWT